MRAKEMEVVKHLKALEEDNRQSIELLKRKLHSLEASGGNPKEEHRLREEMRFVFNRIHSNPRLLVLHKEIKTLQEQIDEIIQEEFSKDTECGECFLKVSK